MDIVKAFVVILALEGVRSNENVSSNKFESKVNHIMKSETIVKQNFTSEAKVLTRGKRYLDFIPKTVVYYRVNGKNALSMTPTLWAYGYGLRANTFVDNNPKSRPFRREAYETWEQMLNSVGLDGKACLLKAFCTAKGIEEDIKRDLGKFGIFIKLLRHLFNLNPDDRSYFSYLNEENCEQILNSHCPLSLNNISPLTDDI